MPLSAGEKLGPYEILAPIGAGGMGEVYRARDHRLNRDVAIKISKEQFTERFTREARAIAALNHTNICHLYDVVIAKDAPNYLVMEYVEGPDLGTVLRGPMDFDEALPIIEQLIDGIEAAHEKNIVHRDLKPSNIKITPEGVVKILDFGLAKAMEPPPSGDGAPENSPTLTMGATQAGTILGTAAYMSPEQAKGKTADRRSDIWSFGVILYQVLTGKRLFTGETTVELLGAVLNRDPDLSAAPPRVHKLLRWCLEKDRKKRLASISDARRMLEDVGRVSDLPAQAPSPAIVLRHWAAWIAAGVLLLALAALAFVHFRETPPPEQTLRYTIAAPENSTVHSFAISPDGRNLVIAAAVGGKRQLWLRPMDALQAQPVPFTEDAIYPFWSPDSRYIGFFAQGKLKKVAASGGPAQSLCEVASSRGGSWSRDDIIVFSPNSLAISIQRVPAAGGVPVDVTKTKSEQRHPAFLPDGRHFLYEVFGSTIDKNGVYVSSLNGNENRRVLADASGVVFAPPVRSGRTGHILFIRESTLMAAPFDAASAQVSGDVFPVADGVSLTTNGSYIPATVSDNGVLLYATGGTAGGTNQLGWYDRTGKSLGMVGAAGPVLYPSISPDERFIVFERLTSSGGDLWVRDLNRGTETRFTTDPSGNNTPFWSPKGDHIVFGSNRTGVANLYQKFASGSGQDEPLLPDSIGVRYASQWSRDGRFIVYVEFDPKQSKRHLWVLQTEGDRKPIPFLRSEFNEFLGQLSPDSHWMAFTSDRSGRREVYVRPFPPGEGEWPISTAGGRAPRWRGDGKELFYEAADGQMMAVAVKKAVPGTKPFFEVDAPMALFSAHIMQGGTESFEYDVTADGKRFLINTPSGPDAASTPLTVVTNWLAGLNPGAKK